MNILKQCRQLAASPIRALTLGCAAACLTGTAWADDTISIVAGYSYAADDYLSNSYFTVTNTSAYSLSDITFTSLGDGSDGSSSLATWSWSGITIAAGEALTLYFGDATTLVTGSGYGFTENYGWTYAGNDQTYSFSAIVDGLTVTATFDAASTATSSTASFLGNDANGDYLPTDVSYTVATVSASVVPEPSAWMLMAAGLLAVGGAGAPRRSRMADRA